MCNNRAAFYFSYFKDGGDVDIDTLGRFIAIFFFFFFFFFCHSPQTLYVHETLYCMRKLSSLTAPRWMNTLSKGDNSCVLVFHPSRSKFFLYREASFQKVCACSHVDGSHKNCLSGWKCKISTKGIHLGYHFT